MNQANLIDTEFALLSHEVKKTRVCVFVLLENGVALWFVYSTCKHTYIFINPRSHMTLQDAKTVSDEIEKGAKEN